MFEMQNKELIASFAKRKRELEEASNEKINQVRVVFQAQSNKLIKLQAIVRQFIQNQNGNLEAKSKEKGDAGLESRQWPNFITVKRIRSELDLIVKLIENAYDREKLEFNFRSRTPAQILSHEESAFFLGQDCFDGSSGSFFSLKSNDDLVDQLNLLEKPEKVKICSKVFCLNQRICLKYTNLEF